MNTKRMIDAKFSKLAALRTSLLFLIVLFKNKSKNVMRSLDSWAFAGRHSNAINVLSKCDQLLVPKCFAYGSFRGQGSSFYLGGTVLLNPKVNQE